MKEFFAHRNCGGAVFVKDGEFFRQQGGHKDKWGEGWTPIKARNLGEARTKAEKLLP